MATASSVSHLYKMVVEDVINNVKEAFLDDGVDEQVLQELRQLWETKLQASKAMDPVSDQEVLYQHKHTHPFLLQPQSHMSRIMTSGNQVQQTIPVPIQLATTGAGREMGAAATATMALPSGMFQQQLAALNAGALNPGTILQQGNGQFIQVLPHTQLQQHVAGQVATTTITIPPQTTFLQSHVQAPSLQIAQQQQVRATNPNPQGLLQLDGAGDTSSSEDEDYDNDDNDDENDDDKNEEDGEGEGEEEEPLNSADDVSEEDPNELFDTDNVVVCQYDKINRNKSKWKFHLKDGIMNLNGRDYVFQKATGDADW